MLANSLTPTKPVSIFDLAAVPPASGETAPAIDFAALLPGAGQPALPEGSEAAADLEAAAKQTVPTLAGEPPVARIARIAHLTLPDLAETGKNLPPVAAVLPGTPAATVEGEPETGLEEAPPTESEAAIVAAVALPIAQGQLPPAAAPAIQAADPALPARRTGYRAEATLPETQPAPTDAPATKAKGAAPLAVALHVARPAERAAAQEAAPVAKAADAALRSPTLHAAPDRGGESGTSGDERPAARGEARFQARAAADLPRFQLSADVMPAASLAGLATAGDAMSDGVPALAAVRPALEAPALRELTRIVETLASAREALGTGTATLALDHAEFGALSLRFDQRGDGLLSVQLSAADADVQQAVANAVADRPIAAPGEAGGSASHPQTGSQSQGGGSPAARGASVERESHSSDGEPQRDQRGDRPRGETRGEEPGQRGQRRSGIYA